ncbi:MAG TPA: response regulator transcription factor [Verrucomicrobiae bacterium]|jgi:DNA-binding NarL/FixJ family response regulator|nr:response regulator transcription factor [Verrucomicrobiae bacterium]
MIRVGIVEDNKTIRESLTHFVQTDPECRCVFACANAEDALQEIPKHRPEVVLMDIQLPGLSGIECTAHIKKILPAVQIIMVTVYEDTERISAALRAGACGYLLKRCTPAELVSAVREARAGGVPMPREIARKVIASFQQPDTVAADMDELRPSERKILELLAIGLANKEIADRLGLSNGTVRWHLENIYSKLHVHSRTEAALKFRSFKSA